MVVGTGKEMVILSPVLLLPLTSWRPDEGKKLYPAGPGVLGDSQPLDEGEGVKGVGKEL